MKFAEFGKQKDETILLLHGGGLSWWNFRNVAERLETHYHVVLPILDGHGGSDAPFTSIEENAARIIAYVDTCLGGKVKAIAGLSLGGQIAAEILSQRADICEYALLESVLVKPMKLTEALVDPMLKMSYGLIRQKWFSKLQAAYLGIPKSMFEEYYRDTCKISPKDMAAFLKANSSYTIKKTLRETKAKVKILAGARETSPIRKSADMLRNAIAESECEILKGRKHGELSLQQPDAYGKVLQSWIGGK